MYPVGGDAGGFLHVVPVRHQHGDNGHNGQNHGHHRQKRQVNGTLCCGNDGGDDAVRGHGGVKRDYDGGHGRDHTHQRAKPRRVRLYPCGDTGEFLGHLGEERQQGFAQRGLGVLEGGVHALLLALRGVGLAREVAHGLAALGGDGGKRGLHFGVAVARLVQVAQSHGSGLSL